MSMRIFKNILVGALALLGFLAGGAFAQVGPTATITVNATVNATCRFQTITGTMTIANSGGVIDPALGTNATGSIDLTYRCTTGTLPGFDIEGSTTFADPKIATVTLTGAGNLDAQITVAGSGAGTGMGGAGDKTATVSALITAANIDSAAVGAYSKNVLITIQAQ